MKSSIKELNTLADQVLSGINDQKRVLKKMGEHFQEGGSTITHEQLQMIKKGHPFLGIEGISSYRIASINPEQILLFVIMGPRSLFKLHDHDCPESGTIVLGDCLVNQIRHSFLDRFEFAPETEHTIYSEHGCAIVVDFGLPPNEKRPAE